MARLNRTSRPDRSGRATGQSRRVTRNYLGTIAGAITFMLPGGCLSPHTTHVVPSESVQFWLPDEGSSPEEILRTLGQAHMSLERGRILVWQLNEEGQVPQRQEWAMRTHGALTSPLTGPLNLVVVLDRPEPELAKIERVRLVRIEEKR